ncbi:MAG TPA: hypothetical protein VEJ46_04635 [Candidatus Acidoferrum sp.]|nr:hypothetical protein [Candidatus Acidoferrum sp.]
MEKAQATMKQEGLMALAILATINSQAQQPATIETVSERLFRLREGGVEIGEIALRRIPGGYYSEDLENLVGRYIASGYAEQRSPIKFNEAGIRLLEDVVSEQASESPDFAARAAKILGLKLPTSGK